MKDKMDSTLITSNVRKCSPIFVKSLIDKTRVTKLSLQKDLQIARDDVRIFNSTANFNKSFEESTTLDVLNYSDNELDFKNKQKSVLKNKASDIQRVNTKLNVSESAPFLVAIFETLSNVTAQTCAGTLLSPAWVLTAASCVNVLPQLHNYTSKTNKTANQKNSSRYTVIINATNPLIDGCLHVVTEIILLPSSFQEDKVPTLALMKINPAAETSTLKIINKVIRYGVLKIFGWKLQKQATGNDVMALTSFSAILVNLYKCKTDSGLHTQYNILCLSVPNQIHVQPNQVIVGAPVVMVQEGKIHLLGIVVQTFHNTFIIAYSVTKYSKLIKNEIKHT